MDNSKKPDGKSGGNYEAEPDLSSHGSAGRSDRWAGYMETSAYRDGERVPVAVNRKEYVLTANDDFSRFEIQM